MASLIQNERIVFSSTSPFSSSNYDDYVVGLKTSTLKAASGEQEQEGAKKRPSSLGRTPSSSSNCPLFRFSLPTATTTAGTGAGDDEKEIEWIEDLVHIMAETKLHKNSRKNQEGTHDDEDEEHPLRDFDVPSTIFIEDIAAASSSPTFHLDCPRHYKKELLLDDMGTLQEALYLQTLQHDDDDDDDDAESAYISEGDVEEEEDDDEHDHSYNNNNVVVTDYVQPLVDTTVSPKYAASKSATKYHKELLMDNLNNLQEALSRANHEFDDDDDLLSQGDIESVMDDDDDHTATTTSVFSDDDNISAHNAMNYNNASDDGSKSYP
jgi:hypothetical protein